MTEALTVLRRSAMQTAKSCMYRFNEVWNKHTPDDNDYSLRGIAFHSCAHRYIERLLEQQLEQDAEEARAAFVEGIAAALTPAHLVAEVREIFQPWAENFALKLDWFLAAEEHQMGNNQQVFTPDLVYASPTCLEIVDFKTYWVSLTEDQIRHDWQARFYVFNAQNIWKNFPVYRFTHSYVRFGKSVSVDFTAAELASLADEVDAIAASIAEATKRNEWPATAGTECSFCTLKCPLADHPAIIPKRFTLPEQAHQIASWVLTAERQMRAAKKALKGYCAVNGAVSVGGVEFDNRPVLQRIYPIDDVLRILRERGVMGAFDKDAAPGLTISHSALSKLMKAYPALEADLLPFQQSTTSYRFTAKKPGISDDEDE